MFDVEFIIWDEGGVIVLFWLLNIGLMEGDVVFFSIDVVVMDVG